MNHKIAGIIFIVFGMSLAYDSGHDLYYGYSNMDFKTIKSAFLLFLGISSCIYGYKQFTNTLKKDKSV